MEEEAAEEVLKQRGQQNRLVQRKYYNGDSKRKKRRLTQHMSSVIQDEIRTVVSERGNYFLNVIGSNSKELRGENSETKEEIVCESFISDNHEISHEDNYFTDFSSRCTTFRAESSVSSDSTSSYKLGKCIYTSVDLSHTFEEKLMCWADTHNIPNNATTDLLHILRPHFPHLPLDARTFLKTPKSVEIQRCCEGWLAYFGLEQNIMKKISSGLTAGKYPLLDTLASNFLTVTVNVDGLPLSLSSTQAFWPLLGRVDQAVDSSPFIIALYYGAEKPSDSNEFLKYFVDECCNLEDRGLVVNDKHYSFRVSCVIADAPARAFVKQTVSHNSVYGCEKCTQEGTYSGRTIWEYQREMTLRSDDSFKSIRYEDHQRSETILSKLSIGLVSQIPLDYLHLICLGVMKKLIRVWIAIGPKKCKLSSLSVARISERLVEIGKCFTPKEFARKPRSLKYYKFWKGTEFRCFILYIGPAVLKGILHSHLYLHFLTLHIAVYILASDLGQVDVWRNYANELLHCFVENIDEYYHKELLTYNVHNLLHIANDVRKFGPLDAFSAFPFENFMKQIKRMVHAQHLPLQQVAKRLGEENVSAAMRSECIRVPIYSKQNGGSLKFMPEHSRSYCCIGTNAGDNCFITNEGTIVKVCGIEKVKNEENCYNVLCSSFDNKTDIFQHPLNSSKLQMFKVKPSGKEIVIPYTMLSKKFFCIPDFNDRSSFLCIPFCHIASC